MSSSVKSWIYYCEDACHTANTPEELLKYFIVPYKMENMNSHSVGIKRSLELALFLVIIYTPVPRKSPSR